MKPAYALLRERCGLSIREAADFHGVAEDTVKSWSSGRRAPPAGVIAELRALYARIEAAADAAVALKADEDAVEFGLCGSDREARALGWPCVGAQAAAFGIAAARLAVPVTIVARGSTPATAAAKRARE